MTVNTASEFKEMQKDIIDTLDKFSKKDEGQNIILRRGWDSWMGTRRINSYELRVTIEYIKK